jgi:hypothetical protein
MAGLVPAIHVLACCAEDVDALRKAGHDGELPQNIGCFSGRLRSPLTMMG